MLKEKEKKKNVRSACFTAEAEPSAPSNSFLANQPTGCEHTGSDVMMQRRVLNGTPPPAAAAACSCASAAGVSAVDDEMTFGMAVAMVTRDKQVGTTSTNTPPPPKQ